MVGPREGFDSKGPEVTVPLDFPLFGGLCWAFWGQSETRGRSGVCRASFEVNGLSTDQIRRVKFREKPGVQRGPGPMTIGK